MYFAGVDIGSTMTKVVIISESGEILSKVIGPTGPEHRRLANKVMEEALSKIELPFSNVSYIVATGYGRINVPFADTQITELSCHAKGVASLFPTVRTAIDVGGQDAKGLKIRDGRLVDFVMNDKCAAGTGRFLEVLAETLGIDIEELGPLSLEAKTEVKISSTCTIFAQQEVITQLSQGTPIEDIIAGVCDAIASRVTRMVRTLGIEPDVVLTGGVAKNVGVVKAFEKNLGYKVLIPEDPLISGALGAAILAKERFISAKEKGEEIKTKERILQEATFFK